MKNITKSPPSWCPDAVPSDRGWRHPVTGELLVSVRGGVIGNQEKQQTAILEVPESKPVISEKGEKKAVIDETVPGEPILDQDEQSKENIIVEKQQPSKTTRRGRNAK